MGKARLPIPVTHSVITHELNHVQPSPHSGYMHHNVYKTSTVQVHTKLVLTQPNKVIVKPQEENTIFPINDYITSYKHAHIAAYQEPNSFLIVSTIYLL